MQRTLSRASVGPRGTGANCCAIIADIKSLRPVSWEMALKRFLILGRTAKHQDWSLTKTSSKTKPLPTGVGRILDMLLKVLEYDVFRDGTFGG